MKSNLQSSRLLLIFTKFKINEKVQENKERMGSTYHVIDVKICLKLQITSKLMYNIRLRKNTMKLRIRNQQRYKRKRKVITLTTL